MADVMNEIMTNDKTKILSGEFLNFYTPRRQRIRSFKVYFSPKQEGSGTPSPENVRPISGWTGVEVGHCGKNLFDGTLRVGRYTDGVWGSTNTWRTSDLISVASNTMYCVSHDNPRVITVMYWDLFDKSKNWIQRVYDNIVTTTEDTEYLTFCHTRTSLESWKDIQLELGSQPTEYVPYKTNLSLPKEYQEVEYIEGTGTQLIKTDLVPQFLKEDEFFMKFAYTNVSKTQIFYGVNTNNSSLQGVLINGSLRAWDTCGYNCTGSAPFVQNEWIDYLIRNQILTCKELTGHLNDYTSNTDYVLCLFGKYPEATTRSSMKLSAVYYKRDGKYLLNLIPCYRKSDKVAGMYDVVTGQFYTNSGTGEFITGPAVNRYDIDWSEDVGTVYGGYVDLVSGELVEEWKKYTLTTSNTTVRTSSALQYPYYMRTEINGWDYGMNTLMINVLESSQTNAQFHNTIAGWQLPNMSRVIYWVYLDCATEDGANSLRTNEDISFIYKLATPITHQLSPTTLSTLMGDNNFWSNADRIEIKYDYIGVFDPIESRKNIFTATPHTATAKDSIVSFGTDMAADLKECKVHFLPKQEGEGDPSPDNVRPIHGWDGVTVTACGKNLAANGIYCGKLKVTNRVYVGSVYHCYYFPIPKAPIYITKSNTSIPLISVSMEPPARNVPVISSGIPTMTYLSQYIFDNTEIGAKYMCIHGSSNSAFADLKVLLDDAELMITTDGYSDTYETSENDLVEITIPFPQTIYGGYVDLINGEIVEEWNNKLITGETIQNYAGNGYNGTQSTNRYLTFVPNSKQSYQSNTALSNYLTPKKVAIWTSDNYPNCFTVNGGYQLHVRFANDIVDINATNDTNDTKTNKIKEYLNENPLQLVYPLKSNDIMHYPIDPQILKALRGMNNIWSNTNSDVEITYWKHGDDAYQHVPSSPITSNDNFIIVTDDGYAIGEEDDFIVY